MRSSAAHDLSIFQPLSISFSTRMCAFPVLLHVCGSLRSSDDDSGDDEGRKTSEQPEAAAKGASKQKGKAAAATKDEPAPTAKGAAFTPSSLQPPSARASASSSSSSQKGGQRASTALKDYTESLESLSKTPDPLIKKGGQSIRSLVQWLEKNSVSHQVGDTASPAASGHTRMEHLLHAQEQQADTIAAQGRLLCGVAGKVMEIHAMLTEGQAVAGDQAAALQL